MSEPTMSKRQPISPARNRGRYPRRKVTGAAAVKAGCGAGDSSHSRSDRLAFCRVQQAIYRAQKSWTYRVLNAGFYLQIKRGVGRV